jgi:DNA repair protein RecO (recombination protein O)
MNDVGADPRAKPAAGRARRGDQRVDQQPGFVLHSYAWRETSLIVEAITRDHGRVALVARGAKRPTSQFRGVLTPFSPLLLAWSGRNDIKTLVRADWCGGLAPLRGDGLLAGFYLNELLVRLLARHDAHAQLFASYVQALHQLAGPLPAHAAALREFELDLLRECGYAPEFGQCVDGAPIDAGAYYRIEAQHGVRRVERAEQSRDDYCVRGTTILALAQRDFSVPQAEQESRSVLRHLIGYHLDGKPLNTRRILRDLRHL